MMEGRMASDDDWVRDLDEYMLGDVGLSGDDAVDVPVDADRAERLLRALDRLRRERKQIEDVYVGQINPINEWFADRTSGIDRKTTEIERALEQYMRALNRAEPKRKSLSLPHGTLTLRASGRTMVRIVDEAAFMAWALDRPDKDQFTRVPDPAPVPQTLTALAAAVGEGAQMDVTEVDGRRFNRWRARVGDEEIPGVEIHKQADDNFGIK